MSDKRNRKGPEWELMKGWGIKRDTYNWILVSKTDKAKEWATRGYFPTVQSLLYGFQTKVVLEEPAQGSLVNHVVEANARVAEAIEKLALTMGEPPTLRHVLDRLGENDRQVG